MTAARFRTFTAACLLVITATVVALAVASVSHGRDEITRKNVTPSTKPKSYGLLLLGQNRRFPARAIPKVARAAQADRLGDRDAEAFEDRCAGTTVDMGDWCIESNPHPVPPEDTGKNDYFYAAKSCAADGGWLPSAAEVLGAVDRIKVASTIDDASLTASIDLDPSDGLKDRAEMTSTLVMTRGGSASAGSLGVSEGSRGNPLAGEPDPVPLPADSRPESLQYVRVYDNKEKGGFAGARPVSSPENFRCAFPKTNREKRAE